MSGGGLGVASRGEASQHIVGCVQPTYLPWLPFFERMEASQTFIYLDDVQYSKNSYMNRNAIKTSQGRQLLTVPVLYKGHSKVLINEIEIDNHTDWAKKHWRSMEQNYSKAEYWKRYRDELETLIRTPRVRLIDLVLPLIEFLKTEFAITTPCNLSSSVKIEQRHNEKLIALCRHFGGSHFIVKPGTEDYHPVEVFTAGGVSLAYLEYSQPRYDHLHGEFVPGLSALDYLLNMGPGPLPFVPKVTFP